MLDKPRTLPLALSGVLLLAFALLTWAVMTGDRVPAIDQRAEMWAAWAAESTWLTHALYVIEVVFGTVGVIAMTAVAAGLLLWRRHRRSAVYLVAVMLTTLLATTALKATIGRIRPEWQETIGLLTAPGFPSGHTSHTAALAGVTIVLAKMLVRRASFRHLIYIAAVTVTLVVAADRVLLGRHYPTDTIGGMLLAAAVVLGVLGVYSPLPRSHAANAAPLVEVSSPGTRSLAVIVNPVKVEDLAEFRRIVETMAEEAGWGLPSWHFTTIEDPGRSMAHDAAVQGADLVIACGGDGTVREACAELAGTGIPVGIVPAGTGNLLARNLDIPLFLRAAIDVALSGQDRAIDLVEVSGDGFEDTHFMVMAGMGLDAAIMEGVNEDIKQKIGWFAYVISGVKSLMSPAVRVEVEIDGGEPTKHRARTVVVGNVGFLQAGMPLMPDAAIDDGHLDIVILHPRTLFSWLPVAWRVVTKRRRTDDTINRMTGRSVVVRAHSATPRQLDGDSVGAGLELRMRCVHGRLLVRVPRT